MEEIKFEEPPRTFVPPPRLTEVVEDRKVTADKLRTEHPGKWAVVSEGHASISSAGVVRRRMLKRPMWEGFEMTSRKRADGTAAIYARYNPQQEDGRG